MDNSKTGREEVNCNYAFFVCREREGEQGESYVQKQRKGTCKFTV